MNKMDENELHHQQQDQVNNNNINMELLQTIDEQSTKCEEMSISTTPSPDNLRICLVGTVIDDANIILAAKSFGVPVITSETGADIISDLHWLTYFIMKDFDGPIFNAIHKSKHRIMGPPALLQAANMKEGLTSSRPIYNYSMKGVMTCFTGIRKKDELTHLVNLIHAMGGSIRKDMKSNITHLICNSSGGDKYRYAMTFRLAIVRSDWVLEAWKHRDVIDFIATDDEFSALHKVRSFEGQHVCFFGFEPDEQEHMTGILQLNGGILTDIDDPECSHVVVNQQIVQTIPDCKNGKTHIVKVDWFWYTIQNGYANEMDHLFGDYLESMTNNTPLADRRDSLPISLKRKRKNFTEQIDKTPLGTGKRRSSVSDAGLLSVSGSFLDYTASPNNRYDNKNLDGGGIIGSCGGNESNVEHNIPKNKTMRYNHFMDLYGTESNYVGILQTIVSLFHKPLEDVTDTPDELLNKSEVKSIFSNFSVIHDVHLEMLNRFNELQFDWSEDCLIGKIILDHREALIKAYPPYVNYFEQMKETLIQCDTQNPRFHAFLKINQAKPECGRQSLQDLMIRPVQRLPSISLLISDILKHTSKTNPDYQELEKALKAIREVMTHINEDKRKTEGRLAMFDIFNDIDNCPPDIVSSHRSFISKCIVTELSNNLSGRDDTLLLFLFTDYMEVCKLRKQRGGGLHNTKSPSINNLNATRLVAGTGTSSTTHLHHYHHNNHNHQKPYKHIKLLSLSSIPCIYDINDSPKAFALVYKDKLYSFSICDEIDKIIYLKSLCKQLAENSCRADTEQFLRSYSSQELGIDISDINLGTLKKAFNYARTRLKVTRAFSFNKTPLKRAISTASSLYDSTNSLTPATQLAQMKLASCSNINEVREDEEDEQQPRKQQQQQQTDNNTQDQQSQQQQKQQQQQQQQQHQQQSSKNHKDVLIAPMSVQPTRKAKNTTISIGSLRRL